IVYDDGATIVAIICVDVMSLYFHEGSLGTDGPDKYREQFGIDHTFLNCTHTHSDSRGNWTESWRKNARRLIDEAVEEAYANRVSVTLHAGRAPSYIGSNRYGKPFTQVSVPWVNTLEARNEDGQPIAILFEYAAHPVITIEVPEISADYPAYAVHRITEELGSNVVPTFALGCAGNCNGDPVGFSITSGWHEKAEEAGRNLGDAVLDATRDSETLTADKFTFRTKSVMLPLRVPRQAEWEWKVERAKTEYADDEWALKNLMIVKEIMEHREQPMLEFQFNALMLGSEWLLVTMAAEMFSEYEVWLNAYAPFQYTMAWGYTNGRIGYIPSDLALAGSIKYPHLAAKRGLEGGVSAALNEVRSTTHDVNLPFAVGTQEILQNGIASLWEECLADTIGS
ncbi:MAG: hypothetical protein OXT74_04155, partial [Candidatus Poribacteria bacterium]|nr:hypothetical protein [Candidatus Poribacteria bacterium]